MVSEIFLRVLLTVLFIVSYVLLVFRYIFYISSGRVGILSGFVFFSGATIIVQLRIDGWQIDDVRLLGGVL